MREFMAAVMIVAAVAVGAATPPAPPKLRLVSNRDGAVLVRWTLRGTLGRSARLDLQTRLDNGTFSSLPSIVDPRRRGSTPVGPTAAGTHAFRARLVTDVGTSDWSAPVTMTVAGGADPGNRPAPPNGARECPTGYLSDVLRLVNDARRSAGRAALRIESHLAAAARTRTFDMIRSGSLSHTGWVETIRRSGYPSGYVGENIAFGYATPAAVMQGWLGSSGHRANILNPGFTDIGIGCGLDAGGRPWWTQDFGG